MDMKAMINELRLELTGDVVDLELSDTTLTKIINRSLREVQRYIDTTKMVTVPYSSCIDVSELRASSIIGVRRAEGYMGDPVSNSSSQGFVDPMQASQWQLLNGVGSLRSTTDYAYNYAAWNTLLQIRNTLSTDLAFQFDKLDNKLYVNISSNIPKSITIIYIPRFDDVAQITSDYWIDVLLRLAAAETKIAVGRVRSKFKQTNALWVLDGEALLQEGTAELAALREQLSASTQLVYGID